jgi:SAM-dependent methyltransferase
MSRHWLGGTDLLGYLLCRGRPRPSVLEWLRRIGLLPESQLLELGSGVGRLLFIIRGMGFSVLTGVDPFVSRDLRFPGGIRILKRRIAEVDGHFEYVVLNHSLEHMDAPLDVLRHVRRLLAPNGHVMISTPIASSFARRAYGVHWVQLDAPRHLFVHTPTSIQLLARQAGLSVVDIVYDSTEFQFWGSEQYRVGISLFDKRSYARSHRRSIFTAQEISTFKRDADQLNIDRDGDSASFYLEAHQ